MDKETEKIVGICKPTYEELESEYGRMADRCEYAEKLNKSLERVIVERDNTIESLTREVEDLEKIIRSKDNTLSNSVETIRSLSNENDELKKELAKAKVNCQFGTTMDSDYGRMMAYKDYTLKPDGLMSVTDVIVARLKDAKEIADIQYNNVWAIITIDNGNIWVKRFDKEKTIKNVFSIFDYGRTWMFVDELGNKVEANTDGDVKKNKKKEEVKSDDNGNS